MNKTELINKAKAILEGNDLGGYTVPTHGLYPFQWNWDAAITALGWMKVDEARAWQEIRTLLKGQWDNGMVPHIVFHQEVESYFPDAGVWGVQRPLRTTSISQPPVLASVLRLMVEQAGDPELAGEQLSSVLEPVIDYHLWWYRERDPQDTGLVVSYHPWESGMDNSPAWDKSLAAVPPVSWQYQRKDTQHVDASERPHAHEYDRYLYLVDFFKQANFDSEVIYRDCPYKMYDVGIIAILHKATEDLIALCRQAGVAGDKVERLQQRYALTARAVGALWSDEHGSFLNKDAITGEFSPVLTTGTMMALWGGLANPEQAERLGGLLSRWLTLTPYGISSTFAECEQYEPQRYWRGPVWLHINWLLAMGAANYGFADEAGQIKASAAALIREQGYYEYFNCETGAGCGGDTFSWTAATALHWLL